MIGPQIKGDIGSLTGSGVALDRKLGSYLRRAPGGVALALQSLPGSDSYAALPVRQLCSFIHRSSSATG